LSQAVDSPIIVLFEDRPKQGMVFQLNMSIYLDARVTIATDLKDLKKAIGGPDGVHLIVARAQFRNAPFTGKVLELLSTMNLKIPVVCLGDAKDAPGLTVVGSDNEVKPLLQAAAKILGITAKHMVSKQRADTYEIAPEFLNMLFSFPCDVFDRDVNGLKKVFSSGETVPRPKVERYAKQKRSLVIDSFQRLKLANAVTEQALKASEELTNENLGDDKKMAILSASLDMVAAQFQSSGMDEETVKLANASIKAVEKIAESATSVGGLVKQLLDSQGGYRYAHCQLITFLGFHVIKMMGWWGDDQRAILSQAAFYHDISLGTDAQAKVRTAKMATDLALKEPKLADLLQNHAQLAARELQSAPEITPEVVRVVTQHHGSPIGRGFSTDIAKLDVLAKTFVLTEEWADYLIDLAEGEKLSDNEAKMRELKHIYKDEQSCQIIETFRYLDPEAFANDFLSSNEVDFAASLISGGGAGSEAESVVVKDAPKDEVEIRVKGEKTAADDTSRKIEGVTDVRKDEEIRLKGEKSVGEQKKRIEGVTDVRKDEEIRLKAEKNPPRAPKLSDMAKVPGEKGDRARTMMAAIASKKPNATPEEVETLLKAGGLELTDDAKKVVEAEAVAEASQKIESVTQHITEEERIVKGEAPAVDATGTKVEGVTYRREDEEIVVKGEKGEEKKAQTLKGVTDVRNDETIVVKSDKSQDLVDRSVRVVKADAQEKERELKMKALAGCTELMKSAVSGAVEKVTELLATASPVEIKKTDAEGRTAVHYAAMGGSVLILKLLVEKGASINVPDSKRRTALFFAALYRKDEAFEYLLAQGSKINQQAMGGMTIAMIAASNGNLSMLKTAIQKGVRADSKDHNGKTALDYAKQGKHAEAIAFLESLGGKPAAKAA
jgi:hypothetical protein